MRIAEIRGEKLEVGAGGYRIILAKQITLKNVFQLQKYILKLNRIQSFFYKLHAMYLTMYFKDLYLKLLDNSAKSTQDNLGFSRAFPAAYAL